MTNINKAIIFKNFVDFSKILYKIVNKWEKVVKSGNKWV